MRHGVSKNGAVGWRGGEGGGRGGADGASGVHEAQVAADADAEGVDPPRPGQLASGIHTSQTVHGSSCV